MFTAKDKKNISNIAKKQPPIYKKNMLVIDHQVPQTKSYDSKDLEPAAHHLYRVKEVQPKNLRLISIIDGTERSLPYEIVKPMSMPDLMEMKFNLNYQ